jgi:hypothetical protein
VNHAVTIQGSLYYRYPRLLSELPILTFGFPSWETIFLNSSQINFTHPYSLKSKVFCRRGIGGSTTSAAGGLLCHPFLKLSQFGLGHLHHDVERFEESFGRLLASGDGISNHFVAVLG